MCSECVNMHKYQYQSINLSLFVWRQFKTHKLSRSRPYSLINLFAEIQHLTHEQALNDSGGKKINRTQWWADTCQEYNNSNPNPQNKKIDFHNMF